MSEVRPTFHKTELLYRVILFTTWIVVISFIFNSSPKVWKYYILNVGTLKCTIV